MVLPAPERMEGMPTKDAAREEVAMQTQERSRRKPVHLIPPRNDSGASLDTLWPQADLIVQARAGSTGNAAAVVYRFEETDTTYVHPMVPTRFDIAEVFKRNDGIPPVPTLALWQLGGEAEEAAEIFRVPDDQWVRFTPGMEYVLFAVLRQDTAQTERVELLAGPKGIYRLDGEQVFVGTSPDPEPNLSRGQLLARLRQLAGTAKR
jgi:hypothetical protein